ncbi:MAG: histidine kinase [Bacteroidetes bacterium]|nr:histidine kinase [Bacteroidota bacterium]MCB0843597.1 histidine kinase [Bacteroidota bacterium]MCB0852423.1 histidine kinase [Bacteroidota bacterium]
MKLNYLYISIHVILWLGIYFAMIPEPYGLGGFHLSLFEEDRQVQLLFISYGMVLSAIMVYTYAHIALPPYLKNNKLYYFLLINSLYIIGFVFLESLFDYLVNDAYHNHQHTEVSAKYSDWVRTNLLVNSVFMLVANLYGFTYGWFREQQTRRSLEQEKLKAELSALKHQINPHFLFNILNGLYGLAFQNDDEPTAEGIAKLSQLMRYMLYESNDPKVPLGKEVNYIENYIDLQKLRLPKSVEINFSVNGRIEDKQIVPMILITFVENAFKHGISTANPSHIHISINVLENDLVFKVNNSNHRSNNASGHNMGGIGLRNVKKRLDLLYKKSYNLTIDQNDDFFEVNLTIAL